MEPNAVTARPGVPAYSGQYSPIVMYTADDDRKSTVSTYAKGSRWCVRSDWYFNPVGNGAPRCQYSFYVPNDVNTYDRTGAGANAIIVIGFYGPDGRTIVQRSDPLDESASSGMTLLTINQGDPNLPDNYTGINIGDNNGQSDSQQIGWGISSTSSLMRDCN